MNAQTNELARSAQGELSCGSCSQPWFGSVAYCPYCGKPSRASTHRRPARPPQEKAEAPAPENLAMPAGELQRPADEPPRDESPRDQSRQEPPLGLPVFGKKPPAGGDRVTPSPTNRTVTTLLFTGAAAVGALLAFVFWMGARPPAPRTEAGASRPPPVSTSQVAPAPKPSPPLSAAPAPTQAPSIPARVDTAARPPSNRSALCSAANEKAGLCKSQ